jgi:signal transduction histidine kinase
MKPEQPKLARSYLAALRKYLQASSSANLNAARKLGLRSLKLGLETLDLARMHEVALIALVLPRHTLRTRGLMIQRAGVFFGEAITPIEQTHRGAREANTSLGEVIEALNRRTLELATSVMELKQEILQRKAVEESLRTSEQTTSKLLEKSRQMQEKLRHLSRQLLSAQEEERRKISRELHDVIAQTLTGINLQLATLKTDSSASAKGLQKKIAITQRLVERSVNIVHRFARDLRPTVLDDLGLVPALRSFLKSFIQDTSIDVRLKTFPGIEQSNGARRTVLYRVAQEALSNVARHAKASQAIISIRKHKGGILMEVADNGQGFAVEDYTHSDKHNRLGLLGMKERVEMVGGSFCVVSSPGKPTKVRVEMPADRPVNKKAPRQVKKPTPLSCP